MPPVTPRAGIAKMAGHMASLPRVDQHDRVIKLASNESVMGPGPKVMEQVKLASENMQWYPEIEGTAPLEQAIGKRFDLDPARIVVGPGSDEILTRIIRGFLCAGDELIYNARGYAKFGNYAHSVDAVPVAVEDTDFVVDVDSILSAVTNQTRIVALANPENPAGTYVSHSEIQRLCKELPDNVLVILDGAYAEYVTANDYHPGERLVDTHENVVMTRTFSKIFGLAGLRLGWAYAGVGVTDALRCLGATFPVSGISIAAGIAALKDSAYTQQIKNHNTAWRTKLSEKLSELGLHCIPSQANFVLVETDPCSTPSPKEIDEFLAHRGILIRRFPRPGLKHCIRITIGSEQDMTALIAALEELFSTYRQQS